MVAHWDITDANERYYDPECFDCFYLRPAPHLTFFLQRDGDPARWFVGIQNSSFQYEIGEIDPGLSPRKAAEAAGVIIKEYLQNALAAI